ncbi:MAG: membrane protein [Acidimicrobiales bacterium]|nr:MAG: membrane protein [Acidimicrobiales bacterium]
MRAAPRPIDPRGPRFNQAVTAVLLALGFVLDWWWVVPAVAVALGTGAIFGPRYGPFLRIWASLLAPRVGPPSELEDPRPPRFAAWVGTVFLTLATVAFVSGLEPLGWVLALLVAALAGLAAVTGLCLGCEIYVRLRMAGRPSRSPVT